LRRSDRVRDVAEKDIPSLINPVEALVPPDQPASV
jgi:hypothetical protein